MRVQSNGKIRRSEAEWERILARFEKSGLSAANMKTRRGPKFLVRARAAEQPKARSNLAWDLLLRLTWLGERVSRPTTAKSEIGPVHNLA